MGRIISCSCLNYQERKDYDETTEERVARKQYHPPRESGLEFRNSFSSSGKTQHHRMALGIRKEKNLDKIQFEETLSESDPDSEDEYSSLLQYKPDFIQNWSKNGIIEFIENQMKDQANWNEKMKVNGVKLWMKKSNGLAVHMKTEFEYNKKFEIEKLAKVVYDPDVLIKWDKNIEQMTYEPFKGKQIGFTYSMNKKQYSISSRDFYDIGFFFIKDGKYYKFSTSVDKSENPNFVRGTNVMNLGLIQPNDEGKLVQTQISVVDFKVQMPQFILNSFLPKATKQWHDEVQKYYQKNHKNL